MFAVGDYVVYGNNGICQVKDISHIDIPGAPGDRMYYFLCPVGVKESIIYSPVDSTKVIMRHILSVEEIDELLAKVSDIPEMEVVSDKHMEMKYKEVIASCDTRNLISMIKTIHKKRIKRESEGKKITATDERYMKKAEENLTNELVFALGKDKSEIASVIEKIKE